jgi:hypothetical protein
MAEMGDSAGLASLSEIAWEVETIEQILTDLRYFYDLHNIHNIVCVHLT